MSDMTEQEAISILKCIEDWGLVSQRVSIAHRLAYKALEKQVPKKPEKWHCMNQYKCPTCEETLGYIEIKEDSNKWCPATPCCWECGQAIDWSEENESKSN